MVARLDEANKSSNPILLRTKLKRRSWNRHGR